MKQKFVVNRIKCLGKIGVDNIYLSTNIWRTKYIITQSEVTCDSRSYWVKAMLFINEISDGHQTGFKYFGHVGNNPIVFILRRVIRFWNRGLVNWFSRYLEILLGLEKGGRTQCGKEITCPWQVCCPYKFVALTSLYPLQVTSLLSRQVKKPYK